MTRRTDQQQKALEVFFRELAEALNDAGFEMKEVLAVKEVDIPWTQDLVKNVLWRPIQEAMLEKHSTTQLEINEVSRVYDVLDRHISSHFGVHVPFPSEEELAQKRGNP